MSERVPLPHRRQNETCVIEHDGRSYTLCVGFDHGGRVREVFVDGERYGSGMAHIISDACTIISVSLQYGTPIDALRKSLGTLPDWSGKPVPASVIGSILSAIRVDESNGNAYI